MTTRCACGARIPLARARLGYETCLPCGEKQARQRRHTVAPINKSNYVYISPSALGLLAQLNPKRT